MMTPTTKITPLPPEHFRRTPWKNGGGVTIDIAGAYRDGVEPGSWQGMIWRLGRTAIVEPGPFSDLSGYERLQMVIEGSGLVLETARGEIDLRKPLVVARYDGGLPIVSRLEHGPVDVVNLIADRDLCAIDLAAISADESLSLQAGLHVLYAPAGAVSVTLDGVVVQLGAGHALRLDAEAENFLSVADGVAIVASIRLTP
jgi:environmental stress-induced protein Ves